jgi:hypothetical protein
MSSGLTTTDTLLSARNITPWHGLGVVFKRHPRSLERRATKSGLGWTVRQEPLYRRDATTVDGWRANLRSDTREVLGVVTNRYTVIQNRDAFAFLANLLGSELAFETAGSLHGGKRVFVTCRLASIDHVEVGGHIPRRGRALAQGAVAATRGAVLLIHHGARATRNDGSQRSIWDVCPVPERILLRI